MNYGRALRIARALAEIEQKDLAARAGLDPSHISLIEKGKRNPTVATLEKLADGLGMPYHLLTLLAADGRDLKKIRPSEVRQLAQFVAKMLLNDVDSENKNRRTRS